MIDEMTRRGCPDLTGYSSDEDKDSARRAHREGGPAINTRSASLWRRPTEDDANDADDILKDHPKSKLVFIHQKAGGLFLEHDKPDARFVETEHRLTFFFAKDGKKAESEYPVTAKVAVNALAGHTAVIDLKEMSRQGAPKRAGAAILHALADEVGQNAFWFVIKNPPEEFVKRLNKEVSLVRTRDGYRVSTSDLKRFLEGRLASLR
jgi:hypothetical protein